MQITTTFDFILKKGTFWHFLKLIFYGKISFIFLSKLKIMFIKLKKFKSANKI